MGHVERIPLPPLVIATALRPDGITGVHSYVRRLRTYLGEQGMETRLVTPFSWARPLTYPVFGVRRGLMGISSSAGIFWYCYWHERFLQQALRRELSTLGECLVFAQDPPSARAALRARKGPHQRVVMAVHFRISRSDEFADKQEIPRNGWVYRWIRDAEREVIPEVDGLVYVSQWAKDVLLQWLPEAGNVPSAVISCVTTRPPEGAAPQQLRDLVAIGNLDIVKNHRYLLEVLAEAKRRGRVYALDVYGTGPLDGDLIQQTKELDLQEQVTWHGFVPGARKFLSGYRAYVHAGYSESFCIAVVEGMAAGLPVVVGPIGPIPELFDDGVEGHYWPLDDASRAAEILIHTLEDDAGLKHMGTAAKERFLRQFDADVVVPRLLAFLEDRLRATDPSRRRLGAAPDSSAGK